MSNIEEYTQNFSFKIPNFNVATWHDELKYNFVAIDALLSNFVASLGFKGEWKKATEYFVNDSVFISDKTSEHYGTLYIVLEHHTTTGDNFDTYLAAHPEQYKVFGIEAAYDAAQLAQDWASKTTGIVRYKSQDLDYSSKAYAVGGTGTETNNAKYYKEQASTYATNSYNSSVAASGSATTAGKYKDIAISEANRAMSEAISASNYAVNASESANSAATSAQEAAQSAASIQPDRLAYKDSNNIYTGSSNEFRDSSLNVRCKLLYGNVSPNTYVEDEVLPLKGLDNVKLGALVLGRDQLYNYIKLRIKQNNNTYKDFGFRVKILSADVQELVLDSALKQHITAYGTPDYSAGVSFSSGSTTPADGVLKVRHLEYYTTNVTIDGVNIYNHTWGGGDYGSQTQVSYIQVTKGKTVTYGGVSDITFFPYYGG